MKPDSARELFDEFQGYRRQLYRIAEDEPALDKAALDELKAQLRKQSSNISVK